MDVTKIATCTLLDKVGKARIAVYICNHMVCNFGKDIPLVSCFVLLVHLQLIMERLKLNM